MSTSPRRGFQHGARPPARPGFTLIELLMAMTLLSIGLLALAGLAVSAGRSVSGGSHQTLAAAVAQARFDSLASVPCQPLLLAGTTAATATTRRIRESWTVTAQPAVNPNSLRLEVALQIPGRVGLRKYVSVIPCRRMG